MIWRVTLDHDQRVVGTAAWNLAVPDVPEPLAQSEGQLCYRFIEADTAEHAGQFAQQAAQQELDEATAPEPESAPEPAPELAPELEPQPEPPPPTEDFLHG